MAVSKRLRYEVMRRDNFTCRYCGSSAPDVEVTIDHVVPVTLGGQDEPGNLVVACRDCNAGKSSISPDAPIVASVSDDAIRWSRAVREAGLMQASKYAEFEEYLGWFEEAWADWRYVDTDRCMSRDDNYVNSIQQFFNAGLGIESLCHAVKVAARAKVPDYRVWRYFCGVCWRMIREQQEIARSLIESEGAFDE